MGKVRSPKGAGGLKHWGKGDAWKGGGSGKGKLNSTNAGRPKRIQSMSGKEGENGKVELRGV